MPDPFDSIQACCLPRPVTCHTVAVCRGGAGPDITGGAGDVSSSQCAQQHGQQLVSQVIKTTIHPKYNNYDGINVDYDIAVHHLTSASTKLPAKLNTSASLPTGKQHRE